MSRVRRSTVLAAVLCSAIASAVSFAGSDKDLNLEAGTMSLGGVMRGSAGRALVNYNNSDLRGGALKTSTWGIGADLKFGYFFIDDFMVNFGVMGSSPIGRSASANDPSKFGVGLGLEYFFMSGSVVRPYLGVNAGTDWKFSPDNKTLWGMDAGGSLGILVGLNENVALDFGVGAGFTFQLNGVANAPIGLELDMGYVGVRGFF